LRLIRLLAQPEVRERLAALSFLPVGDTREHFAAFIKAEVAKWAKVAKDSGAGPSVVVAGVVVRPPPARS
jgi:tripartite-type tricarboxylate transporter receptor subunit TctC